MSQGKTVLLVDDDNLCRKSLSAIVAEFTVGEIREACNGLEGIQRYMETQSDVVFLDINMPEMDGFETLKKIRETNKNAYVVIVSSQATKADVFKALRLGARHYIRKDLPRDCLRPMIRQLMAS